MHRTRELVRPLADRGYRLLWVAQLLSEVGDWAARLALVVLVVDRTGSATWAGVAVAASLVTWLGPGQLVAGAVDHLDRRTVMVGADLVRAAAFLLVLLPAPVGVTVALAAVAGLATPAFHGARSAAQVEVVPPPSYGASVALGGITQDATVLLGYLLGGLALGAGDASTALLVNAATFVASAAVLSRLPVLPARLPEAAGEDPGEDLGEVPGGPGAAVARVRGGAAVVLRDPVVRRAVLLTLAATFSATASETLLVVWAVDDLGGAGWLASLLLAATTLLTLLGTARLALDAGPDRLLRTTARLTAVPALVVLGLLAAGAAVAGVLPAGAGLVLLAAAFLLTGLLFVATTPANVVGGPRLPREVRAVAISVVVGATTAGQALAAVVAGVLADLLPVQAGLAVLVLPAAVVGVLSLRRPVRGHALRPTEHVPATGTAMGTVTGTRRHGDGHGDGHGLGPLTRGRTTGDPPGPAVARCPGRPYPRRCVVRPWSLRGAGAARVAGWSWPRRRAAPTCCTWPTTWGRSAGPGTTSATSAPTRESWAARPRRPSCSPARWSPTPWCTPTARPGSA